MASSNLSPAHLDGVADDCAAKRNDSDVRRAAADIHDHLSNRLGNVQPRADGRRDGLFNKVASAARPRPHIASMKERFSTSVTLLGTQTTTRGLEEQLAPDDLAQEVAQHAFRVVEVGNHALAERAHRNDVARRAARA